MVGEESNIDRLLETRPTISPEPRSRKTPVTILFTDVVGFTAGYDNFLRTFPASDVAPCAQLRKAEALVHSGERVEAGRELRSLIARYPNLDEARQARQLLQRFEQANSILGLQVHQVEPGSFAQTLGMWRGDVITAVHGRSVRSQRALMDMQRSLTPGREVVVRIKRCQRGRGTRELTLRGTP